jgi:hypothetical protein
VILQVLGPLETAIPYWDVLRSGYRAS